MSTKIVDLEEAKIIAERSRKHGKTIGICHGTFDLFHAGHVRYLVEASSMVDILFVSVTSDAHVKKGIGRPVFNQADRMVVLSEQQSIDYVVLSDDTTCVNIINAIKPSMYIKGAEYKSIFDPDAIVDRHLLSDGLRMEIEATTTHGGKFASTTSDLVTSKQKNVLRNDIRLGSNSGFVEEIARKYSYNDIECILDECSKLRVLVVSDAIVDEYIQWSPMDRAPKTHIVAGLQKGTERMAGGGAYIASHAVDYARNVTLLTRTGIRDDGAGIIRDNMDSRVEMITFQCDNTSTKTRYVFITSDGKPQVTSEICSGVRPILTDAYKTSVMKWITENIDNYDVVMIGDFGHGTIFPELTDYLNTISKYKVVNVQANESNIGFNVCNKYRDMAYLTLDTYEAELAVSNLTQRLDDSYIVDLGIAVAEMTNASIVGITMGGEGTMMIDSARTCTKIPVFTVDVLDAIGAGDVFMAISGLVGAIRNDPTLMGFLGNCAGAIKVSNLCTSVVVTRMMLTEYIREIMSGRN